MVARATVTGRGGVGGVEFVNKGADGRTGRYRIAASRYCITLFNKGACQGLAVGWDEGPLTSFL